MNDVPIIYEGINLMSLGMGFVFCFLLLMIGAIKLLTLVSAQIQPPAQPKQPSTVNTATKSDDSVVAAISAALHHHKKKTANL